MSVALFIAAIYLAAIQVWWAAILVFAMGLACAGDHVVRQREALRQRDRRIAAELRRNHHRGPL